MKAKRDKVLLIAISLSCLILIVLASEYEWESWNHYQILGLESKKRKNNYYKHYNSTDIKKAYRQQAQKYHPDKVDNESKEEANARFARIAEAYNCLSDEKERSQYDDNLGSNGKPTKGNFNNNRDSSDPIYRKYGRPDKVYETSESSYDPIHDYELVTVYKKEEWHGENYYRVVAQEFVIVYSRWYSPEMKPMSEPFLAEEGQIYKVYPTRLEVGMFLDAHDDDDLLQSMNRKFVAGLTDGCELVVMKQSKRGISDIIWSTEEMHHHHYSNLGRCFASLYRGQLVILIGSPNRVKGKIWSSNHQNYDESESYYLELDNDGSLTIYRRSSSQSEDDEDINDYVEQSKTGTAAKHVWKWLRKRVKTKKTNSEGDVCIWSTSKVGCNNILRNTLSIGSAVKQGVVWTLGGAEHVLDGVLNLFLEDMEEDDDIIDIAQRALSKASNIAVGLFHHILQEIHDRREEYYQDKNKGSHRDKNKKRSSKKRSQKKRKRNNNQGSRSWEF